MARKSIAPWSERVSEGLIDQPIDSQILASQTLEPTVSTGFIDQTGQWKGNIASDDVFGITQTDNAIANGEVIITPSTNADGTWPLDMTGYNDVLLAIKTNQAGNYAIEAIMGPDTIAVAGLSPVAAAAGLRIGTDGEPSDEGFYAAFQDAAESLQANVWFIFNIQGRLRNQKLLRFKITNNSGATANIDTAFLRMV
jgi:hypothetical protein